MTTLLTVEDLATRWRCSPKAVLNRRHRGELPGAVKIGRKLLWTEAAVQAFELARTEGGGGVRAVPQPASLPRAGRPKDYSAWFKERSA